MKYTGQFRTIKNDLIEVNIITNNSSTYTTELTFAGESPVVITQESPDGIFSPIKSRSCTITITTNDAYTDMYSGSSHGTTVEVINKSRDNDCMFFGYLTPCEYNQPYVYLNAIELEAVDALSSLKDFKYTYANGSSSSIVDVKELVKRLINNIAGYNGCIYLPDERLKFERNQGYNMKERISEDAFINGDDAMTCYEVLEEICNFHNLSLVPKGQNVWFLDYELIAKVDTTLNSDLNNLRYYNLNTNGYIMIEDTDAFVDIVKASYAGGDQNIEIDEVYNSVKIKVETNEIDEDDVAASPIDEASSSTFWNAITSDMQRSDGQLWKSTTRIFEYIHGSYGSWVDDDTHWQTMSNVNSEFNSSTMGYKLTSVFNNRQISLTNAWMEFPYTTGYLFNNIVGETALITQQFNYNASEKVPNTASWTPYVMFFPQAQWLDRYFVDRNSAASQSQEYIWYYDSMGTRNYWLDDFYWSHMGSYPVLSYRGDKDIAFSPMDSSTTNYLVIQGDLLWQQNCTYDNVNYHLWQSNDSNAYYGGSLFQIKDCGATGTHTCNGCSRYPGDTGYNEGWPMMRISIKIGNKYWDAERSMWATSTGISGNTFWLNYHKEDVESGEETLIWSDYNHPVSNLDYTYGIRKDGFAIPITKADGLCGKVSIDIYMPRIPYTPGVLYGQQVTQYNKFLRLDYTKTPPVIFMKDLSFSLESASNDTQHWYLDFSDLDKEKDKDITYKNDINTNNVEGFDDLTLKINTYNDKVKISSSYILENKDTTSAYGTTTKNVYSDGLYYRAYTDTTKRQEMNIIDRYVEHYSQPRAIYNCTIHGYLSPWKCIRPECLNSIRMIVDTQSYDVKADKNEVKLVQYGVTGEDPFN